MDLERYGCTNILDGGLMMNLEKRRVFISLLHNYTHRFSSTLLGMDGLIEYAGGGFRESCRIPEYGRVFFPFFCLFNQMLYYKALRLA
jgi:hypothetical protein